MLRDAAQRARIEKAERNEWRCAAPQHEGRSEIARCSQKNGPEPVHRSGLSDLLPGRARGRGAKERSATATCKIGANLAGGQNLFGQSVSNRLNFA
jgi:hypothetical protein